MLDHGPNRIYINSKIMMDKDIAHANNIRPRHVCISYLKIIRQSEASFADDCDVDRQPRSVSIRLIQKHLSLFGIFLNAFNRFENIQ